jgi:hypothetical protein
VLKEKEGTNMLLDTHRMLKAFRKNNYHVRKAVAHGEYKGGPSDGEKFTMRCWDIYDRPGGQCVGMVRTSQPEPIEFYGLRVCLGRPFFHILKEHLYTPTGRKAQEIVDKVRHGMVFYPPEVIDPREEAIRIASSSPRTTVVLVDREKKRKPDKKGS